MNSGIAGRKSIAAVSLLVLVGACMSATGKDTEISQDKSGTTTQLTTQGDKDLTDSVVWLPEPIIASPGKFEQTIRDNQSPIQSIDSDALLLYRLQYSAGFYRFFSRSTTADIQSEAEFRNTFPGALDHFEGSPEKVGFQTSRTGGYIWRSKVDSQDCIAGRIGTGVGGRASVGASVGMPYNVIVMLFFCDPSTEKVDAVEAFLRSPKLVEDRASFAAYVNDVRSRTN